MIQFPGLNSRFGDVEILNKQIIVGFLGLLPQQGTTQPLLISSNSQFQWDWHKPCVQKP